MNRHTRYYANCFRLRLLLSVVATSSLLLLARVTAAYSTVNAAKVPLPFGSSTKHRRTARLFASSAGKGDRHDDEGLHSYVEGLNFAGDKEGEIVSMGGDPFFLPDDDDAEEDEKAEEELDELIPSMPSASFMGNLADLPGGPLDSIGVGGPGAGPGPSVSDEEEPEQIQEEVGAGRTAMMAFDAPFGGGLSGGGLHNRAEGSGFDLEMEELMDMGGDPFFLDDENDEDSAGNEKQAQQVKVNDEDEWDGWVIENAHFD